MYNFFLFLSSFRQWKNVNYCLLLPKERKDSMAISSFLKLQKRLFHQAEFNFPLCSRMVIKKKKTFHFMFELYQLFMYTSYILKGNKHQMQHKHIWTVAYSQFITPILFYRKILLLLWLLKRLLENETITLT